MRSPASIFHVNVNFIKTTQAIHSTRHIALMFDFRNHDGSVPEITGVSLNEGTVEIMEKGLESLAPTYFTHPNHIFT